MKKKLQLQRTTKTRLYWNTKEQPGVKETKTQLIVPNATFVSEPVPRDIITKKRYDDDLDIKKEKQSSDLTESYEKRLTTS